MMKLTTINRLNSFASSISGSLLTAKAMGALGQAEAVADPIKEIRSTLKHCKPFYRDILNIDLTNVFKTKSQITYLTSAIVGQLNAANWRW